MSTPRRARSPVGPARAPRLSQRRRMFCSFAALVIVAQVAGKANGMTAFWATSFFWLRLAHAIVYWAAVPYLRTVVFTLGFVCVAGLFWEVIK